MRSRSLRGRVPAASPGVSRITARRRFHYVESHMMSHADGAATSSEAGSANLTTSRSAIYPPRGLPRRRHGLDVQQPLDGTRGCWWAGRLDRDLPSQHYSVTACRERRDLFRRPTFSGAHAARARVDCASLRRRRGWHTDCSERVRDGSDRGYAGWLRRGGQRDLA